MSAAPASGRRHPLAELLRFGVVGTGSTILYALFSFAFLALGLAAVVASAIAYGVTGLLSYLGHKLFTFRSGGAHRDEGPRFVVVNSFGFLFALAAPAATARLGADARLGVLLVCLGVPAVNYVAMKLFVFGRRGETGPCR